MSEVTKPLFLNETAERMIEAINGVAGAIGNAGIVYGFHINGSESDPAKMVSYLKDAAGMTPAKMDYTADKFNYGSWGDAFFMPRPCMLKSDGTVAYYLNPDDYSKKADGTASDISNTSFDGNAMMEWGQNGKKIWMKIVPDSDGKSSSVYISDHQADQNFHAWSFVNNQGVMVDHFYTPIYNGSVISSKLRSISGQAYSALCQGNSATTEVTYAKANNSGDDVLWYTEVFSDILLINMLLILISKSTDTQTAFGQGRHSQSSSASSMLGTGTMDTKGLFWGDDSGTYGVKVFGMENWWGNQWRRYAGHINDNGTQKVKLTYGKQDGSGVNGYVQSNTASDYSGYLAIANSTPTGTSGGYIDQMLFTDKGMFPKNASGSSSTYYCDGLWFNNGQVDYARRGGTCSNDLRVGALCCALNDLASYTNWSIGASLSCKPLAA